jgi:hypothetical protein
MIPLAMGGLWMLLSVASPSPAPSASPLKTIVNERTSPVCTALREIVAPLDRVEESNREPTEREVHAADLYDRFNTELFANDHPVIFAAQMESAAVTILQNLHSMDAVLRQSYRTLPKGNADVDALRAQVQASVDLERAIASKVIVSAGLVMDNDSRVAIEQHNDFAGAHSGPISAATPDPAGTMPPQGDLTATPPPRTKARMLIYYSTDALYNELGTVRLQLAQLRTVAATKCAPR